MKCIFLTLLFLLSSIGIVIQSPANASGVLTQGEWSLAYPDFSKFASDQEWIFEVRANGTNEIGAGDYIDLNVYTSTNTRVGLKIYIHSGVSVKQVKIPLNLIKSEIAKANLSQPLTVKLDIDRSFNSKLKDGSFTFSIPTSTFPARPQILSDYLKLNTDFTSPIEFPKECTNVLFSYTMNDPYMEIDEVNFDIIDASGKTVSSTYSYGYRSETIQGKFYLCPYELDETKGPFNFQVELLFETHLNKTPLVSKFPFALAGKYSAVDALVAAMPTVCQKGSNYKTSKSGCPSGYKSVSFSPPTTVQWNTLTRSSSSLKGKKFLVYGCVAQFDSNTGGSKFRAYTLPLPAERYYNGANSLYTGSSKALLKLSEDDAFAAKVTVSGATTYTTLGGRTSVPSFSIKDFVKIGSC